MSNSIPDTAKTKRTILTSTAVLIAVIAFCGGFLTGNLTKPDTPAPPQRTVFNPAAHQQTGVNEHIAQVKQEIARNPQELRNWVHLGNLYYEDGQPTQAISAYEQALTLQPGNADVMTDLATMYRDAGQPERSIKILDEVIASNLDHQNAHFNKGIILMINLARPQEAVAAWKHLLQNIPEASMGNGLGLKEALPMLITEGGTILEGKNNLPTALQAFELALQEDPAFEPALNHKAFVLERLGRQSEALPIWVRLLEANPAAMSPDGRSVNAIVHGNSGS